ncbi:exonuclease domain-containing protein [Turicibacter sp. 1E2]|uniref:exonuclease domain-containing protein n=1 Tax=Turicibacter sp. 1E2 TaxID=2951143 RepID=UPI0021D4D54E|nr:exonuclease domain-containing protein [Turicibacter sp. 1E2]MCU7208596.1 exonuclease domain-containing protein [Turicibacter sp. 1E2]
MNFVAIDFETANEKRASACSLGLVVVKNSQIVDKRYYLIKPKELRFAPMNTRIHGLRATDVKNEKEFNELWPEIKDLFEHQFIVAHNASFDMGVLRATLDLYHIPFPHFDYSCSMLLCRNYFPLLENAKLNTVSHHLGIAFNHHHALADALACATLLLTVNKELGSPSIRALFQHVGITPGSVFEKGYQAPKRGKSMVTSQASPHSVTSSLFNSQTDFFKHQTVVITGPLQSMTRAEAIAIISHLGGTVGSSVTKKTNILITGGQKIYELSPEEMTTKLKKAITLVYHGQDILFLTENEFLSILRGE